MARLHTPLCNLLQTGTPIIQAPMAGGPSSPELVAACSAAGALGSFGFAYTQPDEMERQAALVRAKTDRPFGINLFGSPLPGDVPDAAQRDALACVAGYYAGIVIGGSATCVAEAEKLEATGFDFVIAQGGEAGGHRGSYLRDPYASLTGTLALTRLIVRAVRVPVVAAGGIMDGAGIAAVLALGAQAAQLGTAFLPCPESGAPQAHKDALLAAREDITTVTEKFSGKPARGIANRFIREMNARDAAQLAFPAQNSVTGKLRAASAKAGNPEFLAMWAGQALALSRALPAAELVARLEAETLEALRRTSAFVKE